MVGKRKSNILVVDDEKYICNIIEESLSSDKYNVHVLTNPKEALEYIRNNKIDVVLSDLVMGEHSGVQVLETTLAYHPDAVTILMTAHPTVQTAISVLKKGGYDFLIKPFKLEQLKSTLERGLEHQQVKRDNLTLKGQVEFLKIVNTTGAGVEIDKFMQMMVDFCRKEFSAEAVGILQVNPKNSDIIREVIDNEKTKFRSEVLNSSTLARFTYTKSSKPYISAETVSLEDNKSVNKIFISQPIFVRRKLHGVINLIVVKQFEEITQGQLDVLSILSNTTASVIGNHKLYQDLKSSYLQAIRGLANAIEARDAYTAGHTDRVCKLAEAVARHMGWDERKIQNLLMGCTLHDIGKIGVPDCILNKPGGLSKDELELMQSHPNVGLQIIRGVDLFRPAIPFILAHHERYDGSGYPRGLKGEEIPIEGRLLAVVDTFDAILSDRPYRKGADLNVAVKELIENKGKQFDPMIVDTFVEVLKLEKINLVRLYNRDQKSMNLKEAGSTEKVRV